MDQQEEGWPLGLQPLSLRLWLIRDFDFLDSVSFSTVNTGSSRSTSLTSSNFDSEAREMQACSTSLRKLNLNRCHSYLQSSLSQERNATLGGLIGIRGSLLENSRRTFARSRSHGNLTEKKGKNNTWFSLCTKPQLKFEKGDGSSSLRQFLEMERKACNLHGSSRILQSGFCNANGRGLPLIFQCIGGQVSR